jgi:hypothetical protein
MRRLLLAAVLAALLLAPIAHAWTWPASGPVLQAFLFDPAHPYVGGQHRGIAIGAEPGAPVLAAAAGTVTFAGSVPTSGKSVTITTADGYAVTLTHLGSIAVKKGAAVAEGDGVGTIGATGDADVPQAYVHLGIRVAAQPQGYLDPVTFLPVRVAAPPALVPPVGVVDPAAAVLPVPVEDPAPASGPATESPAEPAADPAAVDARASDAPPPTAAVDASGDAAAPDGVEPVTAAAPSAPSPATDEHGVEEHGVNERGVNEDGVAAPVSADPAAAPVLSATPPADGVPAVAVELVPSVPTESPASTAGVPTEVGSPPAAADIAGPVPAVERRPEALSWDPPANRAAGRDRAPVGDVAGAAVSSTADDAPLRGGWASPSALVGHMRRLHGPRLHRVGVTDAHARSGGTNLRLERVQARVRTPGSSPTGRVTSAHHASSSRRGPAFPVRLALVALLAVATAGGILGGVRIMVRRGRHENEDPRRAGVAVRGGSPSPRPRGGLRRPVGCVRPLPPPEGQRRPHGERHGRARHAGDGGRRQGGEVVR